MEVLTKIQNKLHAPKNQRNNFGNYNYRSCEDILEAVKPLLEEYECSLYVSDKIIEVGGIVFVEARAVIEKDGSSRYVTAQAGIDINRKGMDVAQSFGSSSSYARKYALNGLFLIDDSKQEAVQDPDSIKERNPLIEGHKAKLKSCKTKSELGKYFTSLNTDQQKALSKLTTELKLKLDE